MAGEPRKGSEHAEITKQEQTQISKANDSGKTPVVFVHGLWLLPSSWDRWAKVFERGGIRHALAWVAGRSGHRRGGEERAGCVRQQVGGAGR